MTCNIILIHENNKDDIKGFIIADPPTDYMLIVDENHCIRDVAITYYTYCHNNELKF